jgi:putative ABC transport system permease protein
MVTTSSTEGDPLAGALPGLILAIIALSALSPLAVPLVGRLLGLAARAVFPRSQIRELVDANVRDGVRRSASTAAPVVILVGLVIGFSGTMNVVSAGAQEEGIRLLDGDLIVTSTEPIREQLADLEGVRAVSEEVPLRVRVESNDTISRFEIKAVAVSPTTYLQTHRLNDVVGNFNELRGRSIVLDKSFASSLHVDVGDTVQLRLDGMEQDMQVVATVPYTLSGYPVLLPIDLASGVDLQRRYIIQGDEAETAAALGDRIRSTIPGRSADAEPSTLSVSVLDAWIQDDLDNQQEVTQNVLLAVLGLVTLYVVIAMINAVVIAAAPRSAEFATARLTGLSRKQVIQMALWESLTVVVVGVVLGLVAAGATIASVSRAVTAIVGTRIVEVPWLLLAAATVGAAMIVGVASVLTTLAGTRQPPIAVAGARE